MATTGDSANQNDTTRLINDWRESWMKEIDMIARAASQEPDQNITEADLNYRLQESMNYSLDDDFDNQTTMDDPDLETRFHFGDFVNSSRQQSEASDITSTVGQALIIKQHPSHTVKCFKDPAGVMAMSDDDFAYVDFVWNRENMREMKMHVVSNTKEARTDRIIDFPYVGERVRVVDMDY